MSTDKYLLLSSTHPSASHPSVGFKLGAYIRIEDFNGRPAYQQLHLQEETQLFLYYRQATGRWLVGPDLGGRKAFLRNTTKSVTVPTSGWQYSDGGGGWSPAPDLTATLLLDLSSVLCANVTVSASLGTFSFSPLPGVFSYGRQVFHTTTGGGWVLDWVLGWVLGWGWGWGWVLLVSGGRWGVYDGEGGLRLCSGSAPGMCPADPRAKIDVDGTRNWMYVNREGEWEESSDIIITCSTHPHSNDSSPPDVPRPEDRQPVQVPEESVREEVTIGASADTATGAKKKIFKAPKTDVGLDCQDNFNATPLQDTGAKKKGKKNHLREAIKNLYQEKKQFVQSSDERKTDGGPGHVSKRSQECGSTPPASSSGQEEEEREPRDGAAAGEVRGEDSSQNSQTESAGVHVDGQTKMNDRKICWNCHDTENLGRCKGCYMAWYCDKRCQRADRTRHKKFCKKQQRRRMEQTIFYSREDEVD